MPDEDVHGGHQVSPELRELEVAAEVAQIADGQRWRAWIRLRDQARWGYAQPWVRPGARIRIMPEADVGDASQQGVAGILTDPRVSDGDARLAILRCGIGRTAARGISQQQVAQADAIAHSILANLPIGKVEGIAAPGRRGGETRIAGLQPQEWRQRHERVAWIQPNWAEGRLKCFQALIMGQAFVQRAVPLVDVNYLARRMSR